MSAKAQPGSRVRQLDALRGIAALVVVFNHYVQSVPEAARLVPVSDISSWATPWPWLRFTPLRLFVDGEAAVCVFFVLSGFVLSLPVTSRHQPEFWSFLIKRFCRIYLPFAAAILLVAAAYALVKTAPSSSASSWLNGVYSAHNGYSLASHLLMTGKDMALIPVMWTLIHEMRVSVIFPLIFLAIRKIGTVQTIGACLVISIASSFGMTDSISGSWAATLHFLWMFALGSAIAFNRDRLRGLIESCTRPAAATLVIIAIGLLAVPFNRVWGDFLIGGGAALLVILCLPKSAGTDVLVSPIPLWLGRVSYSLYLIHLPLLVIAVTSGYDGPLLFVLLVTLLIAEVMYRTVESPAHQLGKFLSRLVLRQQRETSNFNVRS